MQVLKIFLVIMACSMRLLVMAQPLDILGTDSISAGMAGAGHSSTGGPNAAWLNPAALTLDDSFAIGISWSAIFPHYNAEIANWGSLGQIPSYAKQGIGGFDEAATKTFIAQSAEDAADVGWMSGITLAGSFPLRRFVPSIGREVTFGGLVMLPGSGAEIVQIDGVGPDSFTMPYLGSRLKRLVAALSLGVEVLPSTLAFGAGVSLLADISGSVVSSTPIAIFDRNHPNAPAPPTMSVASFHQTLSTDIAPIVGAIYRPLEWLTIGASWRGEMTLSLDFDVRAGVYFDLGGVPIQADIPFHLRGGYFYIPGTLTLSIAARPHEMVVLYGDLTYAFTSDFSEHLPVTSFTVDPSAIGKNGELLALSKLGNFRVTDSPPVHADTRDTLIPRIGLEFKPVSWTNIRAGYSYHPSPLETDQGYRNMLLDAGFHQMGLGVSFDVDTADVLTRPFTIAAHGQALVLNHRYNLVGVEGGGAGVVKTYGYALGAGVSIVLRL